MEYVLPLLTAFGLGSIVTALIQAWLSARALANRRSFEEKKSAYTGLLDALRLAAVEPSNKNSKNFAFWQTRCELVGSKQVRKAVADIIATNADRPARDIAFESLLKEMRSDLGIEK